MLDIKEGCAMSVKRDVTLGGLSLLLAGLTYASFTASSPVYAGEWVDPLTCAAIECPSPASCGEPGKPAGCLMNCKTGSVITCQEVQET
jgi:hypothetical protein